VNVQDKIIDFFVTYGFQLVGAALILVAGVLVANWIGRLVQGWLGRIHVEPPVRLLLTRVIKLIVIILALVLAAAKLGVDIAPMVAGIGVIGVGIGLATQGVLSNLFAGLTIIFTKPFRVGEYIEVIGVEGQVTTIDLFTTKLLHVDQSIVVIPNRKIVGEVLHNYGSTRQLDLSVGVAYGTDIDKLETVARSVLKQNPRILAQPPPLLGISEFGDSEIVFAIKPWVRVDDYLAAQTEIHRAVVQAFAASEIEMPFPQREVRVLTNGADPLRKREL
jgi:small conductance mechanosensitive channel